MTNRLEPGNRDRISKKAGERIAEGLWNTMRPKSLEAKFIVSSSLFISVCILGAGIGAYRYEKAQFFEELRVRNTNASTDLGIALQTALYEFILIGHSPVPFIRSIIRELSVKHEDYLNFARVYDKKGCLVAGGEAADPARAVQCDSPKRDSDFELYASGAELFKSIVPLQVTGQTWGWLIMEYSLPRQWRLKNALIQRLVLLGLGLLVTVIGISVVVARRLAKPIKSLSKAMVDFVPGKYETSLVKDRDDELGRLQESFVQLLANLRHYAEAEEKNKDKWFQTEKLAALGVLTASIAHEINNPITGMESCLERLRKLHPDHRSARYLDPVEHSLAHIKKVVRELLEYSKPRKYEFKTTNLKEVVERGLHMVDYQLTKKGISPRMHSNDEDILGQWDAMHLSQVFVNLFMNAVDAMDRGGRLDIHFERERGEARVTIRDTGHGMPEEIRKRIFDPFFTTKEQGKGTGLGLAVSQRIVQDHMGRIECESTPGSGTTFAIYIPLGPRAGYENPID